jgi:fumarate hydratase class I
MKQLTESLCLLVERTSTVLPPDVCRGLGDAARQEAPGTRSGLALRAIALNVDSACDRGAPICQDTGTLTFEVHVPPGVDQLLIAEGIGEAVAEATQRGALRATSVNPLTRARSPRSLGEGSPVVHFEEHLDDDIEVRLLLKGGASDFASIQYSLPCELPGLGRAERDLDGVRKCVLSAVHAAQGRACGASILGVGIGGDRASAFALAERQLLRPLDDVNPEPTLARLESQIVLEANRLGIGTMGFGGSVTVLGCKIGVHDRLPSNYFVTISYSCWALRRRGIALDATTGAIKRWLYEDTPAPRLAQEPSLPSGGSGIRLTTPLSEPQARGLKVGDLVFLDGLIHTAGEGVHHHLMTHDPPVKLRGAALYHCAPDAIRSQAGWSIQAAGPTTSMTEEPFQGELIRRYGVRAVVGKGGMGTGTLAALQECGAVYLHAIGGAAQFYADRIVAVEGVHLLELGWPNAMWHLRVKDFPAVVTMDAHGRSLHTDVERASAAALETLREPAWV